MSQNTPNQSSQNKVDDDQELWNAVLNNPTKSKTDDGYLFGNPSTNKQQQTQEKRPLNILKQKKQQKPKQLKREEQDMEMSDDQNILKPETNKEVLEKQKKSPEDQKKGKPFEKQERPQKQKDQLSKQKPENPRASRQLFFDSNLSYGQSNPSSESKTEVVNQEKKPEKAQKENQSSKGTDQRNQQKKEPPKSTKNDQHMQMEQEQDFLSSNRKEKPQERFHTSQIPHQQSRLEKKQKITIKQVDQPSKSNQKQPQQKSIQKKNQKSDSSDIQMQDEEKILKPDFQSNVSKQNHKQQQRIAELSKSSPKSKQAHDVNKTTEAQNKNNKATKQKSKNDELDLQMEQDQYILGIQKKSKKQAQPQFRPQPQHSQQQLTQQEEDSDGSFHKMRNNKIMKQFYCQQLEQLKDKLTGPLLWRFANMQHKYLNQLRILIQLNHISEKQLKLHHFDKKIYRQLVNKKTKIFEASPLPKIVSQKELDTPQFRQALDELQSIQAQLDPIQFDFDQQHIKGLYSFPKAMLQKQKQEIYQHSLDQEIKKIEEAYLEQEKEKNQIVEIINNKRTLLSQLQEKQKQAKAKNEKLLDQQRQKATKSLFPGQEENKIIKHNEFPVQYKVTLKNKEELHKKLQELKSDGQMSKINQELEKLMKEKVVEQELLLKQKKKSQKYNSDKNNFAKEVYIGDVEKMKNNPKILKLEKELRQLTKLQQEKQLARSHNADSKVSYGSGIRLMSKIYQ